MAPEGANTVCAASECSREAAFFVFAADAVEWAPICQSHAERQHPSLEVHAWLEAGFLRPAELGKPNGPPGDPRTTRSAEFRREIRDTMGWST